jgi:hypothetical protein
MPLEDVLVHTAWPWRTREAGEVVDGDVDATEEPRTPFDCCLFLPQGTEEGSSMRGGRQVRRPTLLVAAEDALGQPPALSHEDELDIVAEELNLAEGRPAETRIRWQVDGSPQPLGKPGEDVLGYQVTLVRVED